MLYLKTLKSLLYRIQANVALRKKHGQNYNVGCIPCLLDIASGGVIDYAKGELKIPYAYGMELRDTGAHSFMLPPDQIIPTGEEVMAFHVVVAEQLIEEFA